MIKIKVPATSANMGPGFDCLGIALNLYNIYYFEEIKDGFIIEGCENQFANKDNLIYKAMERTFERLDYRPKGVRIKVEANIPISRGLGSSAACIIGGVVGANEIAGRPLNKKELLDIATEIEGHPDNVTPALYGGMTVSIIDRKDVYYSKINLGKDIKFNAIIPEFKLSTKEARDVLPREVSYGDAVYNIGRVSLMMATLINGEYDLLKVACKDKLHQGYRGSLIEQYNEIIEVCERAEGLATFLSGAGPTIMAMVNKDNTKFKKSLLRTLNSLNHKWEIKELEIENNGISIEKL